MRIVIALLAVVTMGAGCINVTPTSRTDKPSDPIDFRITNRSVQAAHWETPAADVLSADRMIAAAKKCNVEYDTRALAQVAAHLQSQTAHVYHFTYTGTGTTGENTWTVTVVPNIFSSEALRSFSGDAEACFAGSDYVPLRWNANWLALASQCPDEYNDERSSGCRVAQRSVRGSLDVK